MIEDITGITSDCQDMLPAQEMPEAHDVECICDSCCQISISNCQDNRDQCEKFEQSSERMTKMKKMRDKFMPIMATSAVILAVTGLLGSINLIKAADSIRGKDIAAIQRQAIPDVIDDRLNVIEVNKSVIEVAAIRNVDIQRVDVIDIPVVQIPADIQAVEISNSIVNRIIG